MNIALAQVIDIPDSFAGDLASSTGSFFGEISDPVILIVGTLLAVTVAGLILSFLHK